MLLKVQIGGKIAAMVIAVACVGLGVAFYARQQLQTVAAHFSQMTNVEAPARIDLSRSSRTVVQMGLEAALLIGTKDGSEKNAKHLKAIDEMYKRAEMFLKGAKAALPDQLQELNNLDSDVDALKENLQPVIDMNADGDTAGALDALGLASATIERYTNDIRLVNEQGVAALRQHADALAGEASRAGLMMAVVSIVGAALGVALALLASRRAITRPIVQLRGQMRTLASGDTSVVIGGQARRDEIGGMAQAVQTFKDAALAKARLEAEAAALARATEADRARHEAERVAAAEAQGRVVTALARGLAQLSHGDLVFRIAEPFGADYEGLRVDFNAAMDQLQEALGRVAATTFALRTGTGEISAAADDLSRRTEQQAASLEETAAALDQIAATVRKTSQGATHARDVVGTTKAEAERSGQVVGQAVAAMTGIAASLGPDRPDHRRHRRDRLPDQPAGAERRGRGRPRRGSRTRLRGGRLRGAGPGPALRRGAKEIKALILSSRSQVEQGVALVGQTGTALDRIIAQIADINSVVAEIAASARNRRRASARSTPRSTRWTRSPSRTPPWSNRPPRPATPWPAKPRTSQSSSDGSPSAPSARSPAPVQPRPAAPPPAYRRPATPRPRRPLRSPPQTTAKHPGQTHRTGRSSERLLEQAVRRSRPTQ